MSPAWRKTSRVLRILQRQNSKKVKRKQKKQQDHQVQVQDQVHGQLKKAKEPLLKTLKINPVREQPIRIILIVVVRKVLTEESTTIAAAS